MKNKIITAIFCFAVASGLVFWSLKNSVNTSRSSITSDASNVMGIVEDIDKSSNTIIINYGVNLLSADENEIEELTSDSTKIIEDETIEDSDDNYTSTQEAQTHLAADNINESDTAQNQDSIQAADSQISSEDVAQTQNQEDNSLVVLKLTGEEETVEVGNDTVVTIKSKESQNDATVEDINQGDIIQITMDGDTASLITVLEEAVVDNDVTADETKSSKELKDVNDTKKDAKNISIKEGTNYNIENSNLFVKGKSGIEFINTLEDTENLQEKSAQNVGEKNILIESSIDIVNSTVEFVESSPVFTINGTITAINLENSVFDNSNEVFLDIISKDAYAILNCKDQIVEGNIVTDDDSSLQANFTSGTCFKGNINIKNNSKYIEVVLDGDSSWVVVKNSYISVLRDEDEILSNIITNGNTIYYDADNSSNSWLKGKTVTFEDGGKLTPEK